jgi:hypothetical protein
MKFKQTILLASIFLAAIGLPTIYATLSGGTQSIFGGFLLNPIDGNSYLAKMQIGFQGEWLFHLPYSIEKGDGAYLYLFYLGLGKIAYLFGLPLVVTFHVARIMAASFLFFSLFKFGHETFLSQSDHWQGFALILAAFGSGMGWIAILFGWKTSDLWVAEGYPFLASYTNPHFPLGMGLILWIFMLSNRPFGRIKFLIFPLGWLLAVVLPFGVVISGVVLVIQAGWTFLEKRKVDWLEVVLLGTGGGLFLIYQFVAILADPVLAEWNLQNQTPAPDVFDFLVSISPAIIFALVGARFVWKEKRSGMMRILLIWLLAGFILTYLPMNIQRRFFSGYYIPVAFLAVVGIRTIAIQVLSKTAVFRIVFLMSLPTLILVVGLFGFFGISTRNSNIFLERSEIEGFQWVQTNLKPGSVVITGPETGLYIPAYTSMKVVYGHPFETIHALERKQAVADFFNGEMDEAAARAWLNNNGAEAVLVGPRDKFSPGFKISSLLKMVYQSGNVEIYTISR